MAGGWAGATLATKIVASVVAVAVVGGGGVALARALSEPAKTPQTQLERIEAASRLARNNMLDYADWVEQHPKAQGDTAVLACPSEIRALADHLTGYTILSFSGDEDPTDEIDDSEISLFKGTPEDLVAAHDVAFFIPGIGTTWANGFRPTGAGLPVDRWARQCQSGAEVKDTNWISSANLIASDADRQAGRPTHPPIVIAWLGYNSPNGVSLTSPETWIDQDGPVNSKWANQGGETLAQHVGQFTEPAQHVTLIGHSYGSLVAGYALWKYRAVGVDDLVTGGSPGLAVSLVTDTGAAGQATAVVGTHCDGHSGDGVTLPKNVKYTRDCVTDIGPAHFWAMKTYDDQLIGQLGICKAGCGWTGDPPHGATFGANVMNTNGHGYPVIAKHGDYFKLADTSDDSSPSATNIPLSVVNAAAVMIGRYHEVDLVSQAPGVKRPADVAQTRPPTVDWANQTYDLSACLGATDDPSGTFGRRVTLHDGAATVAGSPTFTDASATYKLQSTVEGPTGLDVLLFDCNDGANRDEGLAALVDPRSSTPTTFVDTQPVEGGYGWSAASGADAAKDFGRLDLTGQEFFWTSTSPAFGPQSDSDLLTVFHASGRGIVADPVSYIVGRQDSTAQVHAAESVCRAADASSRLPADVSVTGMMLFTPLIGGPAGRMRVAEAPFVSLSSGISPVPTSSTAGPPVAVLYPPTADVALGEFCETAALWSTDGTDEVASGLVVQPPDADGRHPTTPDCRAKVLAALCIGTTDLAGELPTLQDSASRITTLDRATPDQAWDQPMLWALSDSFCNNWAVAGDSDDATALSAQGQADWAKALSPALQLSIQDSRAAIASNAWDFHPCD